MSDIEAIKEIIKNAESVVFFGGAGVSTESGIPDFRSADGLYHQKYKYNPEMNITKAICCIPTPSQMKPT